jgi:hypothetical protein
MCVSTCTCVHNGKFEGVSFKLTIIHTRTRAHTHSVSTLAQ